MAGEEVVAQAVYVNTIPLWEPVIFGNPLYIWLIIFLVGMIGMMLVAFKLEVYDRLEAVWGHRFASFYNKPEAIHVGMSGKISIINVDSIAGIFAAMNLPMKWIQTVHTQGQLGKVNTIIVQDDWNIVHDLGIDYAILHAVKQWNKKWKEEGHKEGDEGFIYDFDSFEKHLMDGSLEAMFPAGIKLPPFRVVNLHEIKGYLPVWTASHFSGYIEAELKKREKKDEDEGKDLLKWAMIAGGVVLVAAIFGYVILSLPK